MENWQTLIVGLVGFAGVIATLVINGRAQRTQRKWEVEKSSLDRKAAREEAAGALRMALYSELTILSGTMRKEVGQIDEAEKKGIEDLYFTLRPLADAYEVLIGKIDLLTSHEIHRIMVAYYSREEYIEKLTQMSENPKYSVESAFTYHARKDAFPVIKELSIQTTKNVESAKAALEKHLVVLPDDE